MRTMSHVLYLSLEGYVASLRACAQRSDSYRLGYNHKLRLCASLEICRRKTPLNLVHA